MTKIMTPLSRVNLARKAIKEVLFENKEKILETAEAIRKDETGEYFSDVQEKMIMNQIELELNFLNKNYGTIKDI